MPYLPFFYEVPYLYLLQAAFTIWMLIDCSRRRAETYWFWVILFFPGFGSWAYFFAVKARDFHGGPALTFWPFQRRASLSQLRQLVEHSPTPANHMELASRLVEMGEHAEAIPHLEVMLKREPDFSRALYGLSECQLHLGQPDQAVPLLEKIINHDPTWSDYQAFRLLREVRAQTGDAAGALAVCQDLVRFAPTLRHKCLLAESLLDGGQRDAARTVLEKGIQDFQFAPRPIRWRNRQWASQAKRLRKRISTTG